MEIAARCLALREHFGLSARGMSARLGIAQNNWFQYELGRKEPSMATLRSLADLGVSMDWMIAGRGQMFVGDHAPTPSRPGDGLGRILKALELVLKEQGAERIDLWATIAAALSRSSDGMTLEQLSHQTNVLPTDPPLLEQLAWLQKEGVIGYAKGVYRLIRASYSLETNSAELQGLLAVRDLLGTMIPAVRQGIGRGRLMRIAETPASGPVLERLGELVKQIRLLNSEALAQTKPDGAKTFQLVFASLVTE